MRKVALPSQDCSVIAETDVLVVGAGPGGIGAAVGAAQQGADVTLIDDGGCLGGNVAKTLLTFTEAGLATSGDKILVQGVWKSMMDRMSAQGKAIRGYELIASNKYYPYDTSRCEKDRQISVWDLEAFKFTAEEIVNEMGIHVRLFTLVTDVIMEDEKMVGVVIDSCEGKQVIMAKRIVDATGNATLMRKAGVEYDTTYGKDGGEGPITIYMRCGGMKNVIPSYKPDMKEIPYGAVCFFPMMREGEFRVEMTRSIGNGMKVDDLTRGVMECRKQIPWLVEWLRKNWKGCENIYLMDSSPFPTAFVFPKIYGVSRLEVSDIENCTMPEDRIALCGYGIDIWAKEVGGQNYLRYLEPGQYYGISYNCLVPKSPVENILAAGRIASYGEGTETGAMQTPTSMATGQAAGTACALSIKDGVTPRDVNVNKVQAALLENGVILDPIPHPPVDRYPVYNFTY